MNYIERNPFRYLRLPLFNMAALLTLTEMAERLSVSTKTLKKYVRERGIPHIAFGRSLRFNPATVEAYMTATIPAANVIEIRPTLRKSRTVQKSEFAKMVGL